MCIYITWISWIDIWYIMISHDISWYIMIYHGNLGTGEGHGWGLQYHRWRWAWMHLELGVTGRCQLWETVGKLMLDDVVWCQMRLDDVYEYVTWLLGFTFLYVGWNARRSQMSCWRVCGNADVCTDRLRTVAWGWHCESSREVSAAWVARALRESEVKHLRSWK